ncbi:hypothetical protein Taro_023385 [Colocasia esculenta]|uniref:Uncharacterized protein n=1 Tax=Colocasia esculenta TaxID=4460 RepID=A0A843V427_COLES|nr:hypothetical protein [Colocasia esculenta]
MLTSTVGRRLLRRVQVATLGYVAFPTAVPAVGPFVRDSETERQFLCCVVRVGYWHHEPVVRSRVVAPCFPTRALLLVVAFGRTELSQALLDQGSLLRGFAGRFDGLAVVLAWSHREDVVRSGGNAGRRGCSAQAEAGIDSCGADARASAGTGRRAQTRAGIGTGANGTARLRNARGSLVRSQGHSRALVEVQQPTRVGAGAATGGGLVRGCGSRAGVHRQMAGRCGWYECSRRQPAFATAYVLKTKRERENRERGRREEEES